MSRAYNKRSCSTLKRPPVTVLIPTPLIPQLQRILTRHTIMTSSRVDKASKGAGKRRHHARRGATDGGRHTTKISRRGRKFPNYDRVAPPDHEVVIPGSSHDPGIKKEKTANADDGEHKKDEKTEQVTSQARKDSAKGQATIRYTNAKFSGPRNLEQLKKRHDELAEYIRRTKKDIAAQKAEKEGEGEKHG